MALEGAISLVILALWLVAGVKIATENERFAVSIGGRFKSLQGPGLLFRVPGATSRYQRLRLGDRGLIQPGELARFDEVVCPCISQQNVRPGDAVSISGFEKSAVVVRRV